MITPYPPPPGPRVELLRVRRIDPTGSVERSGPSPLRDPRDQPPLPRVDRADFSDEALRRLAEDLSQEALTESQLAEQQRTLGPQWR
jgi:hypothetical protein